MRTAISSNVECHPCYYNICTSSCKTDTALRRREHKHALVRMLHIPNYWTDFGEIRY